MRRIRFPEAPDARPDARAHRRLRASGRPGTTCPYCGTTADDVDFTSPDDVQAALREIGWAVSRDVGDFLKTVTGDFNRHQARPPGGSHPGPRVRAAEGQARTRGGRVSLTPAGPWLGPPEPGAGVTLR